MSTLSGKVLNIQQDIEIQGRTKKYIGYRLVLQTPQGETRSIEKTMASLKYTPSVGASLNEVKVGDDIAVSLEKNTEGFLDVKAISKGELLGEEVPLATGPSIGNGGSPSTRTNETRNTAGKVIGSTYETPEERKLKQRLIVRQAALNQALEYTGASSKSTAQEKVLEIAAIFESWVYRDLE